ncbi:MAG: hypothetical protein AABX94_01185 [Nanoarchaeota archaeon]
MVKVILSESDDQKKQIEECIKIIDEMSLEYSKDNKLVLDLSSLKWMLCCSALLLSGKIVELKNKGYKISIIPPEKSDVSNYLTQLGFPLGGGKSKDTFIPIHHFFIKEGEDSTKLIEKEIGEIFKIIEKNFPSGLINGVFYLVGEMADNVDQHSKFTQGSVMVQFYNKKGHIDIAILDNGITIPGAYEKNNLEFRDDSQALTKALSGISTKVGELGRGKGLGTSKKLVTEGLKGDFYILSRKGLYWAENGKTGSKLLEKPLNGTLICMRFKAPGKDLNIYPYIE